MLVGLERVKHSCVTLAGILQNGQFLGGTSIWFEVIFYRGHTHIQKHLLTFTHVKYMKDKCDNFEIYKVSWNVKLRKTLYSVGPCKILYKHMSLIALYIEDHSFWSADLLCLLCSLIQNKEVLCYQVVYTKTQQYFDIHIFFSLCLYKIPLLVSEVKCRVRLFATPWTIESMEFSKPEYWSG